MTTRSLPLLHCFIAYPCNSTSFSLHRNAASLQPRFPHHRLFRSRSSYPRKRIPHPRCLASAQATLPTSDRLATLRDELVSRQVHAIIIPSADPHNSEYGPACYARRAYISGFSGSAGTAVVTRDAAYLWTDGRYFLQAENQLDTNWTLMRAGLADTPTIPAFLAAILPTGSAVGIDPFVHSVENATGLKEALEKVGCQVVSLRPPNPIDIVWGDERPTPPQGRVRSHHLRYAGQSVEDKLTQLRTEMENKKCNHMLLSMLDEVCWVYNIRGEDIPHCPVVLSYALISQTSAALYIDHRKLDENVRDHLESVGVVTRAYESVVADITHLAEQGEKIWLDAASTSLALSEAAGSTAVSETTPVPLSKSCKNEAELEGMRESHLRDGVALSSFLCWLEDYVNDNDKVVSETDAADKLEEFRASQEGFLTTSFETIAGSGSNGAIIHYSPVPGKCGSVSNKEVFLLDSGGQYYDGTTDVTRTMHLGGTPNAHEKECFTRVLQGHIAIDTAIFPEDTTGLMLDTLARKSLWSIGLDFRHGTGHGVGACLNVHEGPQSISPRIGSNKAGLKPGMIVSNEPGYYEDGSFGIRIENLLYVVRKETKHDFGGKSFLGFERLTYVPIDMTMIETSLLSADEIAWINNYHEEVWQKLSPRMRNERYKEWLWDKTRPLLTQYRDRALEKKGNAVGAAS